MNPITQRSVQFPSHWIMRFRPRFKMSRIKIGIRSQLQAEGTLTLKIESKEQAKLMMQVIIEQDGSSAEYEIMGKREVNTSWGAGVVEIDRTFSETAAGI